VRHHHDPWRASRDPYPMQLWIAYRIKGSTPVRFHGAIYATTEADALVDAYEAFKCQTPSDRRRVFVTRA
jgi:hypothetical protein